MDGHKVRIKKYKNGMARVFLDDRELKGVGSYELLERKDSNSEVSSIKIELVDLSGIIIEEEE